MKPRPWLSGGLCLALYLAHSAALGDYSSISARSLGKKRFTDSSVLLTQTVPRVLACLDLCRGFELCVAFSYDGVSCQLRGTVSIVVDSTIWVSYVITQQPDLNLLMDPCASSPCPGAKVCVRYSIPAQLPYHPEWALNFTLPGYVCTSATSLLAQRDQGKSCRFVMYWNTWMSGSDISSVTEPFYEAFDRCSNLNCTSICTAWGTGMPGLLFKNSAPFLGTATTVTPNYVCWFPECA
ncbi:uncharacterized protein LOC108679023 [Hyalella azteca]|uniref:Uncharacterized protein LOC108679023 n=1 Tax=Hyalella azteca TaxID=294128 RepID=A0A8B7PAL5_HYAAZ|nr:uncharacterized protein LOC108679023 [Hyalella azteca]